MNDYVGKDDILKELQQRVEDKILEPSNYDLLKKLVENADTLDEAIKIAELGTTYRRTGFHFDKKLEKQSDTISYFKKNEELSFTTDSAATTHKLIIGDNYPALLNLLVEYKGRVDVIYIDPPYGKDSMGEFAQTNYENAISRDNLLSMLYPRLWLAKQLLSDTGVIFCSIDDKNNAYLRGLFDEVFGESNFIANIVWERAYAPVNLKKHFSESHDYILVYAKNINNAVSNGLVRTDESNNRYSNPDNDPRGAWKSSDMSVGPAIQKNIYEIVTPSGRSVMPPNGRSWVVGKEKFDELVADNRIYFGANGSNVPSGKRFFSEVKQGITPMTLWKYTEVGHSQSATKDLKDIFGGETLFAYPKPVSLIKKVINLYGKSDSVILDFFSGSGTTGQAVLELNKEDRGSRQFILVTNNEVTDSNPNGIAYDATSRRLKRVMTGEDYDGENKFKWLEKNKPLGDNLLVVDLAEVANFEATEGKTAFDVIDETLYGQGQLGVNEKIEWVAKNFEQTQKRLEEK